jgi:hypothetical protein
MNFAFWLLAGAATAWFVRFLVRLDRAVKARVGKAEESLAARGYVVDEARHKPAGHLTRVWGRLSAPTPLYLQISNIDTVSVIAGAFGIADMRIGSADFDDQFVVRSNHRDSAVAIIQRPIQEEFLSYGTIRFRTGSIDSLLGADYFRKVQKDRDVREFWMIEVGGKLNPLEQEKALNLARRLVADVESRSKSWVGEQTSRTGAAEGR